VAAHTTQPVRTLAAIATHARRCLRLLAGLLRRTSPDSAHDSVALHSYTCSKDSRPRGGSRPRGDRRRADPV